MSLGCSDCACQSVRHWAIEHSQWMVWWLTTMVPEWLCCHVSAAGLEVISGGPWALCHNDTGRLVCLKSYKVNARREKGNAPSRTPLQVAQITLSCLDIMCTLCWTTLGECWRFSKTSPDDKSHFQTLFLFSLHLRRLMNNAGAVHIATPDHDSIIAPVIWTKTFSVSNLLQGAPW